MTAVTPEERLERRAREWRDARDVLEAAIRDAKEQGLPLRTIATATGFSPEWVRRIASR